ncbi:hypothetical protein P879_07424 [Paragonimus westermani]|uniref:Calpain catalytic domain-containing protein n=1 Tax=Paragonimus westermani TaxID=34504 RepID=A0A8T0DEH4_9TREM|nr:hypothetical protein P879_07424 [Paragonimus westermani]
MNSWSQSHFSRFAYRTSILINSPPSKPAQLPLWPEWSDQDINNEKWDGMAKTKDKIKSPSQAHLFFTDPEGMVLLPPSLSVAHTKRPHEILGNKTPVVFDLDSVHTMDLFYCNEHLFKSETMRWIICEIQNLWLGGRRKIAGMDAPESTTVDYVYHWQPWTHIYAVTKVGKEPNVPQYNPYGKYAVKLFWMGCWRKVIVDDQIPFDEDNLMLLPQSRQPHELWPMLLTKALLKIASLDYGGSLFCTEFGDFSAVHCLTGWLKHTIVIKSRSSEMIWDYLEHYLPVWKRPDQTGPNTESHIDSTQIAELVDRPAVNTSKEKKESGKEKPKDKKGGWTSRHHKSFIILGSEKVKDSSKEKKDSVKAVAVKPEESRPSVPGAMLFASHGNMTGQISRFTADPCNEVLKANRLSDMGFGCLYSNPICLSAQRNIPLVAPTPGKPIPRWKLIRPLPPDFQLNECAAATGTQERREAEPIRSLLLCTSLHRQSFREPVDVM